MAKKQSRVLKIKDAPKDWKGVDRRIWKEIKKGMAERRHLERLKSKLRGCELGDLKELELASKPS